MCVCVRVRNWITFCQIYRWIILQLLGLCIMHLPEFKKEIEESHVIYILYPFLFPFFCPPVPQRIKGKVCQTCHRYAPISLRHAPPQTCTPQTCSPLRNISPRHAPSLSRLFYFNRKQSFGCNQY